jgi:hypothetical protein
MKMADDWIRNNYPELVKFLERETNADEDLKESILILDSFAGIMKQLDDLDKRASNLKGK